jgi:hypothetical protein
MEDLPTPLPPGTKLAAEYRVVLFGDRRLCRDDALCIARRALDGAAQADL